MECWAIKQWNDVFEDYRSRPVARLRFLPFDLTRNSEAYRMLVSSRKGVEAYGVFWALALAAARCPVRGVLADERGRELSTQRLAVKTGMSAEAIDDAIAILSSEDIGWLVRVQCPHPAGNAVSDDSASTNGASSAHRPTAQIHRPRIDEPSKIIVGASSDAQNSSTPRVRAQNSNKNNNSNSNMGAPAAADMDPEVFNARVEYIKRRPDWLPQGKPWMTQEAAEEIAASWLDKAQVDAVLKEAKASKNTLDNPAGYVRKKLREIAGVMA